MKTYVLMLSQTFPATHPKKGDQTEFKKLFLNGVKIHTIRANYPLWEKRVNEIQQGRAVLSVRQWSGRPYCSKQIEIARLTAEDGVGIQRLYIYNIYGVDRYNVWDKGKYGYDVNPGDLAINDGLTCNDWLEWFKDYKREDPLAIIHFTKFRY